MTSTFHVQPHLSLSPLCWHYHLQHAGCGEGSLERLLFLHGEDLNTLKIACSKSKGEEAAFRSGKATAQSRRYGAIGGGERDPFSFPARFLSTHPHVTNFLLSHSKQAPSLCYLLIFHASPRLLLSEAA